MAKPPMKLLGDDSEPTEAEELELVRWLVRDRALRDACLEGVITEIQYWWATTSDDTPDN